MINYAKPSFPIMVIHYAKKFLIKMLCLIIQYKKIDVKWESVTSYWRLFIINKELLEINEKKNQQLSMAKNVFRQFTHFLKMC